MKQQDFNTTTRREFLEQLALGAGAMGISLIFPEMLGAQEFMSGKTVNPQKVLVLGAGMAGLTAAWELRKAGHQVQLLEARDRPGGRVSTVREPFAEGLYAEEGAAGFSEAYTTAVMFIEEFGLERKPYPMPQLPVVHHLNGKRFVVKPGEPVDWPYELSAEERDLGPWGLVTRYIIETLPPEASQSDNWEQSSLASFDTLSLADYMRAQGASEGAIQLVQNSQWFATIPEETSALSMALSDFGLFMSAAPFVLAGGNDLLPRRMAEGLKEQIRFNIEIASIHDDGEAVKVVSKDGEEFTADRVICTFPAPVVRKVRIEPALPEEVQQALTNLPYLDVTRTYLQVDRPFWREQGVAGTAVTDLPIGGITGHTTAADPEAHPAILESYVSGTLAEELGRLPKQEVVSRTLEQMKKVHPGLGEHFHQKAYVKAWSEDPYTLGGNSWPAPGDVGKYLVLLQRPHGRIHFAGEHTSILRSTMEGAMRSGVRAALEIEKA